MEVSVKLVRVFFGIATGFLEHFRAEGGSVAIPGMLVHKGYIGYYGPLLPQPQCVAWSVAGAIRDEMFAPNAGRLRRRIE